MEKRVIAVFTVFAILFGGICLRLYDISTGGIEQVNLADRKYKIDISPIRGDIVDCNGEKLVATDYENIVAAKPTHKTLNTLSKVLDTQEYKLLKERITEAKAITVNIGKLEIEQNSDAVTLKRYLRCSENQMADHIVGYVNSDGEGVMGIEKCYDDILSTDKMLSVKFNADVYGRVLSGAEIEIENSTLEKSRVMLSIDRGFQTIVENALDLSGVKQGGAVVVEIETGAIKAIASRPDFNGSDPSVDLNAVGSPFFNRTLNAFSVGSVFKVVVAAAAIENGFENYTYNCSGSCEIGDVTFSCNDKTAHGQLDICKALECSCNTFFIALAQEVGSGKICEIASLLGFGQEISLADGLTSVAGILPTANELSSAGALANFSFGQGRFTATMLQLSNMMSAVASDGKYRQPYLIENATDADGTVIERKKISAPVYALSKQTSAKLTEMLISVIENGNASKAKLKNSVLAAGKTATAQTGTFDENSKEIYNTWFAGFFPADNPRYTVVVLKQGGTSGAADCAPVFKRIADKIYDLEIFSKK